MEESIREAFDLVKPDLRQIPALNLAFLGDAVYELILRHAFTEKNDCRGQKLHKKVEKYVAAVGQSKIADGLEPFLTEEETAVFKRARNAHPESVAKHATLTEYRKATALEALIGYLYLDGQTERAVELVKKGLHYADGNEQKE